MGRWITGMFSAQGAVSTLADDGCSVCDHPFGHLTHVCISSIDTVPSIISRQMRLPETDVA
jgi:hypothetical protein